MTKLLCDEESPSVPFAEGDDDAGEEQRLGFELKVIFSRIRALDDEEEE